MKPKGNKKLPMPDGLVYLVAGGASPCPPTDSPVPIPWGEAAWDERGGPNTISALA